MKINKKYDKYPDNAFMIWVHCDCDKCDKNLKKHFPIQYKLKQNGKI